MTGKSRAIRLASVQSRDQSSLGCCFLCCQESRRRNSVLPFSTIWTDNTVRFLVKPGRVLNVLHLPHRKPSGSSPQQIRLDGEENRKSEDSPFVIKLGVITDSSSDEEGKTLSRTTMTVKVEMERPRTNDSSISHSSRLSLPPLITPPVTPVLNSVGDRRNSGNKKVRWRLRKRNRRASATAQRKKFWQSADAAEKLKEMEKIENLPPLPEKPPTEELSTGPRNIPTPLFQRRTSARKRPGSAKSAFGEILQLEGPPLDVEKRAVFFLHGVGGCFHIWKNQIRCLSDCGSYSIIYIIKNA